MTSIIAYDRPIFYSCWIPNISKYSQLGNTKAKVMEQLRLSRTVMTNVFPLSFLRKRREHYGKLKLLISAETTRLGIVNKTILIV